MAQINIFGELHNVTGEPIAAADQVRDNVQGKMQSEINAELYEKLSLAGTAASDYPTSINLRDIEGVGKGFDSLENIFTYEGEATTWRIVSYGDVDHAEDEDPTYDYCVFRIGSGDKYMVYYMPEYVEEGKHAFQYEETLSKDEIYDPIKKAYDIPEKANVKKLSYNRRDIFQSDRIQVFVGESGNVLTPVYLRHGALQYILFKDGDIYVIYHKSSGNVYAFSNTYSDATAEDWVKEAFETGKTYTAGDGISIGEDNVIAIDEDQVAFKSEIDVETTIENAQAAVLSAQNAFVSESNAKDSETKAEASKAAAKISEENAKESETIAVAAKEDVETLRTEIHDEYGALVPRTKYSIEYPLCDNTLYNFGTVNGELAITMPSSNVHGIRIDFVVGESGVTISVNEAEVKWLDYQPEDPLQVGEHYVLGILDGMISLQLVYSDTPADDDDPTIDELTEE